MQSKKRFHAAGLILAVAVLLIAVSEPQLAHAQKTVTLSLVTDKNPGPATLHGIKKVKEALKTLGITPSKPATYPLLDRNKKPIKNTTETWNYTIYAGLSKGSGKAAQLLQGMIAAPPRTLESFPNQQWISRFPEEAAQLLKKKKISLPEVPESLLILNGPGSDSAGNSKVSFLKSTRKHSRSFIVVGADDRGLMYALLDVADRIGWASDPANPLAEVREADESPYTPERALSMYTMHQATFESFFHDEKYWERFLDMMAENRYNTFALLFGYENNGYFAPPYPQLFDTPEFPDIRVTGMTPERQRRNLASLNRIIEMTHERGLDFTLGIWDHIYRGGVQGSKERAEKPTPGVVWGLNSENLTDYTVASLRQLLKQVPNLNAIQFRMHGESGLKRGEMGSFWESVYQVMNEEAPDVRFDARAKNYPDELIDKAIEMGVNLRICTKYWMEQMGLPFHPTHVPPQNQHDRRHGYADLLRYPKRYDIHWRLWNSGTSRILLWGDPEYARRFAKSTHLYDGKGFEVNYMLSTKMQDQPHEQPPFELLKPEDQYYDWEFERYWHFHQVFGRMGYNPDTPPEVWGREFERRFGKEAGPYVEKALHRASQVLPRIVAYCYPYNHFPTTRGWAARQRQEDLPVYAKSQGSDTQQFQSPDDAARDILDGKHSPKLLPRESANWFSKASSEILELAAKAEIRIGDEENKEFISTLVDLRILAHLAQYHAWRARAAVPYSLFVHSKDLNALDDAIRFEGRAIEAWEKIVEAAGDTYPDDIAMGRRSADLCGHWKDELAKLREGLAKLEKQRDIFKPQTKGDKPAIASVPVRRLQPGRPLNIRATLSGTETIQRARVFYATKGEDFKTIEMKAVRKGPRYRAGIPKADVKDGLRYYIEVTDQGGDRTLWPERGVDNPVIVTLAIDNAAPTVEHAPILTAPAQKPLKITAKVTDPSGVQWVRLRFRHVTQYEDYKTLEMTDAGDGIYKATVPGEELAPQWDFMYFIEAMDQRGNGRIHPNLEKETPYVIVKLQR